MQNKCRINIKKILEKCGLEKNDYTVKISSRNITDLKYLKKILNQKIKFQLQNRALDKINRN